MTNVVVPSPLSVCDVMLAPTWPIVIRGNPTALATLTDALPPRATEAGATLTMTGLKTR